MAGYNLPDNVSECDPDAPWNQTYDEDEELPQCRCELCGWEGLWTEVVDDGLCPEDGGMVLEI